MKQVFLSGKGEIEVFEVPIPMKRKDSILVRNAFSVISAGTEGKAVSKREGLGAVVEKVLSSTDRIEQVWNLAKKQGIQSTLDLVKNKLADYTPLGYSSVGQVVEVNGTDGEFEVGDLVACMGTGFANHAEYIVVPKNLAVKLPEGVKLEEAAFGSIACIAEQGIRILDLTPGESVVVVGLGLIGILAVQFAQAMGYRVFGTDLSQKRVDFVKKLTGIEAWALDDVDLKREIWRYTKGYGADGVVICAATKSDEPINQAFDLCRRKGRVSLVGDVGLGLQRAKMYKKELSLHISSSYGPGRYDERYELKGEDYPQHYVRWTEKRNLEYFLDLLAEGKIQISPIISQILEVEEAKEAYKAIKSGNDEILGVLLKYADLPKVPEKIPASFYRLQQSYEVKPRRGTIGIGFIGCGSFAKNVHFPNAQKLKKYFTIAGVASRSGSSAAILGKKYKVPLITSDYNVLLDNPDIHAVIISTRHASHATIANAALKKGKHVFVEKPMAITTEEAREIERLAEEKKLVVRVGFNRRFAPYLQKMKEAIGSSGRKFFTCRVNISGGLDHWSNTVAEGGRFLGEGTHFLDLSNWFMGEFPTKITASYLGEASLTNPNVIVLINYPSGSLGQVFYMTEGHDGAGKEYFEAHGNGVSAICNDYKTLQIFGKSTKVKEGQYDKGHLAELEEFALAIRAQSSNPPEGADAKAGRIATQMALLAVTSAKEGKSQSIE